MDVFLVPYLAERYRRRRSGIFAQAVASGKIVIVPRGTTMAAQGERFGIASCIPFDTPSDLPDAIAQAIDRISDLREAARAVGKQWLARRPTMTLLNMLLDRPRFADERWAQFCRPVGLHVLHGPRTVRQRPPAQPA